VSTLSEKDRFISIIKDHKRIIYNVIYAYCRNHEDRKDLEQEVTIHLWKSLKTYNNAFKLSTWIYRIALNVAISHYRKDHKRLENNTSIDEGIFRIAEDQSDEEYKDKIELLYQFINKLDDFNKAIIILYLDNNSYKDISEILGITESNVGTKVNRIKNQLKESFSQLNNS
jgi:RNA polymerase sigma factor (sigma-70 family)